MYNLLALEGGVCAGKTTTAYELAQQYDNTDVLHDYTSYIDEFEYSDAARLPDKYRLRYFLRLDEARQAHMNVERDNVIIDRSIFTLIAYEYSLLKLSKIQTLVHVREQLPLFRSLLPHTVVFLDVSDEERLRRSRLRGKSISPPLLDTDFNDYLREFFRLICERWNFRYIDASQRDRASVTSECALVLRSTVNPILSEDFHDFVGSLE